MYEQAVKEWLDKGYLVKYDADRLGPPNVTIPIFAVVQPAKQKVRPVMDYREINRYIDVYSGCNPVCLDKIRKWRTRGAKFALLDLKETYLQIRVNERLWSYQTVMENGLL